ncbi:MAG: ABC transporter permease [Acidobacteriia bacterium]|nr:ABC transporter permease [Methyloceanibacter sp.]MBX5471095.1 ABC transporter permease [Acetobacteraceae bacterium]MCL6492649.1 ABC transporter permease [Terriglobia bacterium]
MRAVLLIAGKEVRDGLRNRWVAAITGLLAVFALSLAFLGTAPTGTVKVSALAATMVSLASLSIFLLPLIGLLLSFDAIVGEAERGTLALMLAYPVARWQVIFGKFLGHLTILGFATVLGYGVAGAAIALTSGVEDEWGGFLLLIGSSILFGAVFIALGYVVSLMVRERATAGGVAIGVWLLFVLVYDLALLGILVADQGRTLGAQAVAWLLLLNPADAFRTLNLLATPDARLFSGLSGLAEQARISLSAVAAALVLWVVVPLAASMALFRRKQI